MSPVRRTSSRAIETISEELDERIKWFRDRGKLIEAQRIEQRTRYDMEMLREVGTCKGIENYSRHITGLAAGMQAVYADRLYSG